MKSGVGVELDNLSIRFGDFTAVRNASVKIEEGKFFSFLGPSGCGKTTILRTVSGFQEPSEGVVRIGGQDVAGMGPNKRPTALIFQNLALFPLMKVWENIAFALEVKGVSKTERRKRADELLELIALSGQGDKLVDELSGGQKQRVAVARALAAEPQVLLLDEPLSNLDKKLRVTMRQELLALQRKLGITTIFVTHDQEEAMTTADRMAVLDGGILQQVGAPAELFDFPANRFVAGFVGTTNLLDGVLSLDGTESMRFDAEGVGPLRLPRRADTPPPGRVSISFRPHVVQLQDAAAPREPSLLWLAGTVEAAEFLGETTRYRVRVGTVALTADQPHFGGTPQFTDGTPVAVGVAPSQLRYLPC